MAGGLTLQYALHPRTAAHCTLVDGWTEHCLSNSDTVVHSFSPIILLLTGYNHFCVFVFIFLSIFLVLLLIYESANVYF